MMRFRNLMTFLGVLLSICTINATAQVKITDVKPTPFFPKVEKGNTLKQLAHMYVESDKAMSVRLRISVDGHASYTQDFRLKKGLDTLGISVLDINKPTKIKFELLNTSQKELAVKKMTWQPQKKWTIFCVSYSHQDLGFGNYPHKLRTTIRHANIRFPLQFCTETDSLPKDEQYRFEIETSEAIPSFIGFYGKDKALELGRRIREGRIQVGAMHNTANTEQYSHELMARQFYLSGRHTPDLLQVSPGYTAQQTDVIGMTLPFATYAKEAGIDYMFHGFNRLCMPNQEEGRLIYDWIKLDSEIGESIYAPGRLPAYYWQGPDGQRLLCRATTYERHGLLWNPYDRNPSKVQDEKRIELLTKGHEKINWPFDCFLSQDGTDFLPATKMISDRAKSWNSRYSYPHLKTATLDMYFKEIEKEIKESNIKIETDTKDGNNQWSDQDATDAKLLGKARIAGEAIPATEKLATLAQAVSGGGYQWTDIYQAYHRLMQYHEHTNARISPGSSAENLKWYETELEENREMVAEAEDFQESVRKDAQKRLSNAITRKSDRNLIVFNPLPHERTDIVRCDGTDIPSGMRLVDSKTGKTVAHQILPDNTIVFVAEDIPATGYKTYALKKAVSEQAVKELNGQVLENAFYRMEVNRQSGVIASLRDKELDVELVEQDAPDRFNEYLYQRFDVAVNDPSYQYKNAPTYRMEKADVSIQAGSVADVITIKGAAEGAKEIRQTVILYHHLKRIDFGMFVDKNPSQMKKEAVLVAFPFNVPDFTLKHELPGAVIEPFKQQVEGSCTAHHTIRSFTDIANDKYGITVSPINSSQVCYGWPRTSPMGGVQYTFDRSQEYPEKSRLYLYLMNNMFSVNITWDQQGPASFNWAIRSHAGDWKAGEAAQFGRQVLQPLISWRADGEKEGTWPETGSFMSVDQPNITCSTVKPAEANGQGIILRFNETTGQGTTATVSLPFLGKITSVNETSLVENDRGTLQLKGDNTFEFTINPFGVKTIRVICDSDKSLSKVSGLKAVAKADMQINLKWKYEDPKKQISHFNVYRDKNPACEATLLNLVGQTTSDRFTDQPQLNYGGWIRRTLEPDTDYYYRIVAVDRYNNVGEASESVEVRTLKANQKNLVPIRVECVRAILISPITNHNFVNLLFRTSCESDISHYEIHRSGKSGFSPGENTLVGKVSNTDVIPGSAAYGDVQTDYLVSDFDHAMFADRFVKLEPESTFYYKICAVDMAGQKGAFSRETVVTIKSVSPEEKLLLKLTSAQSFYSDEYGSYMAVDGVENWVSQWASKQYGGGTKQAPNDVWWAIKFPETLKVKGVKKIGDDRDGIPLLKNFQIQIPDGDEWKTIYEVKDATTKTTTTLFDDVVETKGIRIFVPAKDLPESNDGNGGIVRICELRLIFPGENQDMIKAESFFRDAGYK